MVNGSLYQTQPRLIIIVGDFIWIIWNPKVWKGELMVMKRQFVTMNFKNMVGLELIVTFVYTSNVEVERRALWENIICILTLVGTKKWLVIGDFNEIFSHEQFSQGVYFDSGLIKFRKVTKMTELNELGYIAVPFTRMNKAKGTK